MARKKKKAPQYLIKFNRKGEPIDPALLKARQLRNNLLSRVKTSELRDTTPTIKQLHKWLSLDSFTCYYSLQPLTLEEINIDHKIPLQRGGTNSLSNLCYCSSEMNSAKGTLNEEEFRELLELIRNWDECAKDSVLQRLRASSNIFRR